MQRFALIARQRSGTGFFSTVLNNHPAVHFFPEVFLGRDFARRYSFYRYHIEAIAQRPELIAFRERPSVIAAFFDHIFSQRAYDACREEVPDLPEKALTHIGLDIKYTDLKDEGSILQVLKSRQVRIIHLVRRNVLKLLISELLNNKKNELGRKAHMEEVPPAVKVRLPVGNELIQRLDLFQNDIESVRQTLRQHFDILEITYEELIEHQGQHCTGISRPSLDLVYDFMGIDDRRYDLSTKLRKTNPDTLRDVVENYDEVRQTLTTRDFRFLHLLD